MIKWIWNIKQDNLTVAQGIAGGKRTAATEAFRYANQYIEETFSKMTITIKELKQRED